MSTTRSELMQGKRLTERQAAVLEAIREHVRIHGEAPSRAELGKATGLRNQTAVDTHLQALQRKGWITLRPGVARGIQILRDELAIYGEVPIVAAGTPVLAEDGEPQPQMIGVNALLRSFEQRPDFFVEVRGDSMDAVGIKTGDLVGVRRDPDPEEGNIVIARIGSEITMKRYQRRGECVELEPQSTNPEHETIRLEVGTDVEIVGIVVGAIIGTPRS